MLILVGGTTGTGKTEFSRHLSARLRLRHIEGDQLRVVLQEAASPSDPINFFRARRPTEYLAEDPGWLCAAQERVSAETCERAFRPVLEELERTEEPALLEGDDLLPTFAAEWQMRSNGRTIFAVEFDESMTFASRKAPGGLNGNQLQVFLALHRCRGLALATGAREYEIPIVTPRRESEWQEALNLPG